MHLSAAFACLLTITALTRAAGPATLPTQTSDGVAYGDAQPIKGFNPPNFPVIGRILGVSAGEWAGRRKIITRSQSSAEVQKIEQREKISFSDATGKPEFVLIEQPGRYDGFNVDAGRISEVFYSTPKLSNDERNALAAKINQIGRASPVGFVAVEGGTEGGYPLIVRLNRDQWYLAQHQPTPVIESAIRNHEVVKGMTEAEANAAMSNFKVEAVDASDDVKQINYYLPGDSRRDIRCSAILQHGQVAEFHQY